MERTQTVCRVRSLVAVALTLLTSVVTRAQSARGENMALSMRSNVVQVAAHFGAGTSPLQGFGFIVGADSGRVYIVTANHVVRGDGPDEVDRAPTVIFFQDPGHPYTGELLSTSLSRSEGDLAVIRVQAPSAYTWNRNVQAAEPPARDTEVWFVGKLGEWYVPTRPGSVNEVELRGTIRVDGLPVSTGTSGAPLISENGIVGMVVTDGSVFSEATPLDLVKRAIEKWNYPWQLMPNAPNQPVAQPSRSPIPTEERPIRVWKVGSPHTGATPDQTVPLDLDLSARKIGHALTIESFPAKGFADRLFDAYKQGEQPDILAIDNYGIIDGITTPLGSFTGVGSSKTIRKDLVGASESLTDLEGRSGGWEFLLSSSKNFAAAKLLALRSPECERTGTSQLPKDLQKLAPEVAWAYLEGKPAPPKTSDDAARLNVGSTNSVRQVSETKECGYWGDERLAFVPMVFSFESAQSLGQITVLLAFRKEQNEWRLLTSSTDPMSNGSFVDQLPKLAASLQNPRSPIRAPAPAKLIAPDDGHYPQPAGGERFGNFVWQPSKSGDVVAEVVEFAYDGNSRLFARLRSSSPPPTDEISSGQLWTTKSPWKWRVWSISGQGAVSFSEARSFNN